MNTAMHTIIMAVLFQTYNIKILNANDIEVIDIHQRELMQELISLAVDSLMQFGNLIFGLFCTSWILYLIAFGVNNKGSQTDIQTYCFSRFW